MITLVVELLRHLQYAAGAIFYAETASFASILDETDLACGLLPFL
jgi:hypothetical protein